MLGTSMRIACLLVGLVSLVGCDLSPSNYTDKKGKREKRTIHRFILYSTIFIWYSDVNCYIDTRGITLYLSSQSTRQTRLGSIHSWDEFIIFKFHS